MASKTRHTVGVGGVTAVVAVAAVSVGQSIN